MSACVAHQSRGATSEYTAASTVPTTAGIAHQRTWVRTMWSSSNKLSGSSVCWIRADFGGVIHEGVLWLVNGGVHERSVVRAPMMAKVVPGRAFRWYELANRPRLTRALTAAYGHVVDGMACGNRVWAVPC